MRYLSVCIVLALALSGCASKTPTAKEVKASPANTYSFSVSLPYEEAYSAALGKAKACYEEAAVGASVNILGTMYPDSKRGEISEQVVTAFGPDTTFVAAIQQAESGSVVTVYDMSRRLNHGQIIESWFKEGSSRCK